MDAKHLFTFSEPEFSSFGLKLECAKAFLANSNISTQNTLTIVFSDGSRLLIENLNAECCYYRHGMLCLRFRSLAPYVCSNAAAMKVIMVGLSFYLSSTFHQSSLELWTSGSYSIKTKCSTMIRL